MLIRAGANINAVDHDGSTALHIAVSRVQLETVRLLIRDGIDPSPGNGSGKTPLHIAIDLQSKPMVECLLSNGASLADLRLLYDEQVQWAKELLWYSQLTLRKFDYSAPVDEEVDVLPPCFVLEVRWMLHDILRLPSKVVSRIMDLSEYWAHSFIWWEDRNVFKRVDLASSYISVKLNSKEPGSLRKIVFTTKSHEELKFSILDKPPVYDEFHSRFEVIATSPTGKPSPGPHLIQPNVSNSHISRIHVNTWEYKDRADWMKEIHPGDLISMHTRIRTELFAKNVVTSFEWTFIVLGRPSKRTISQV